MVSAEAQTRVDFSFQLDGRAVETYCSSDSAFHIRKLKCYVSNIRLKNGQQTLAVFGGKALLLDALRQEENYALLQKILPGDVTQLVFGLGIDSIVQTSGIMDGNLDPASGMYWTWQSGYIHLKFEGQHPQSSHRKKEFQYHIGGYRHPYNSYREITLPANGSTQLVVRIELRTLLDAIDFAGKDHVMSPGAEAIRLSDAAVKMFSLETNEKN